MRSQQPEIKNIEKVRIPAISSEILSNGVPLYFLNMGDQEVSRIDIMIEAGKWQQPKMLVATFVNLMLKEGTIHHSSKSMAELLDYYGAWLQLSQTHHYSYITLYTINRFFKESISLLEEIIKQPVFPEGEFHTILSRRKQQFFIDSEKVYIKALRGFLNCLYGDEHPYGSIVTKNDYDVLRQEDIVTFYKEYYGSSKMKIILSGKLSDEMLQHVESTFGKDKWGNNEEQPLPQFPFSSCENRFLFIQKQGVNQNAIRMGLHTIDRLHPDFLELRILNTLFGGFFGSRLMSNIREDKGYTYGISSAITSFKYASYLSVATQTAPEHTRDIIDEVYKEIDRLQQEPVKDDELEILRNYMLGDFVRSFDGVFSVADIYISLIAGELPFDFYQNEAEIIKNITSERLQLMAQQYLVKDRFYEVIAGKL